jgi:uncharacterized protein
MSLRDCRLRFSAATRRERTVRNRAICHCGNTRDVERTTAAVDRQSGDLRAHGDANDRGNDANAGNGNVRIAMNVDFPFHIDDRGRAAATTDDDHLRDLIEQVLFTSPGERVNLPTFGSGILQLVFAPNSDVLAAATQVTVQSALQQWLGDLIEVQGAEVTHDDATLFVKIQYVIRRNQQQQVTQFSRPI